MTDPLAPLLDLPGVRRRRRAGPGRVRGAALARGLPAPLARGPGRGGSAGDPRVAARSRACACRCRWCGRWPPSGGRDEPVVVGALRATALVERWMPALGDRGVRRAPAARPAARAACTPPRPAAGCPTSPSAGCASTEQPGDLTGLGPAPVGDELAARVDLLGRTVRVVGGARARRRGRRARRAARPCGRSAPRNGVVARAVARLLLTARGPGPDRVAGRRVAWAAALNPYLGAAAGFATGSPAGVAAWVRALRRAVAGAAEARVVADGGAGGLAGIAVARPR